MTTLWAYKMLLARGQACKKSLLTSLLLHKWTRLLTNRMIKNAAPKARAFLLLFLFWLISFILGPHRVGWVRFIKGHNWIFIESTIIIFFQLADSLNPACQQPEVTSTSLLHQSHRRLHVRVRNASFGCRVPWQVPPKHAKSLISSIMFTTCPRWEDFLSHELESNISLETDWVYQCL